MSDFWKKSDGTDVRYEDGALPWHSYQVPVFKGLFDSGIKTNEEYETRSLASFFAMGPYSKPKISGPAFVPSLYQDYDAREHAAQRQKGEFVALTGDIDSGNHSKKAVVSAVKQFVGDAAWLVYASPHARPSDMRWRIIAPLDAPQSFSAWFDAQSAFFTFMEERGFAMDKALARAAQPVFLPNVPAKHAKSGTPLRGDDGEPLYYDHETTGIAAPALDISQGLANKGIAAIRLARAEDEKRREQVRKEAEARRAKAPRGDGASLMEDFNASNSVASVLEICGYEQCPRGSDDWRSPYQTGETYATRVVGSKWISLSESDVSANIGEKCQSGCFGDAYDLFVHYKHGGDHKSAYRALGAERSAANVHYLPQAEPPSPIGGEGDDDLGETSYGPSCSIEFVEAFDFREQDIPLRPWLVPGALLAGNTHILAAPGGTGKSLFTLQFAIMLARGQAWGHWYPKRKFKVMIINAEDDVDEQRRRLSAARTVMEIPDDEVVSNILMAKNPSSILTAQMDDKIKRPVATPLVGELVDMIRFHGIDAIIVDPFAETFEGDENSNNDTKWAMKVWRDDIARATGTAVYLVHHTTKGAGDKAGSADVIRGAGALVNSARLASTLFVMTEGEASGLNIDPMQRFRYVRYDDAKANQSLIGGRHWFEKISVIIQNGEDGDSQGGDEVGALRPWTPDGLKGIDPAVLDVIVEKVADRYIDEGGLCTDQPFAPDKRGGSKRWIGYAIMAAAGCDDKGVKPIYDAMIGSKLIHVREYHDEDKGRDVKGVFAGASFMDGGSGKE